MDRDDEALLSVGTGVDYTKVDAINHRQLLAFVNHFVTHTVHFLNKFSCVCEEKLLEVSTRIQQLEVTMSLLEGKLGSVSGLESVTASEYQPPESVAKAGGETVSTASAPPPAPAAAAVVAAADSEVVPVMDATEAPVVTPAVKTVSEDNRYKKYFDLNRKGVPIMALRPKMLSEGLNPDLLETPDAPAPDGGDNNDDDMFTGDSSNSEESEEDSDFDD